jgi:hypothetical protein
MAETSDVLVVDRDHPMDYVICLCLRAESKEKYEFIESTIKHGYKPGMTYVSNSICYTAHSVVRLEHSITGYEIRGEGIPVLACKHCLSDKTTCILLHLVRYCKEYESIFNSREKDIDVAFECHWGFDHHYDSALLIQSYTRKFLFRRLISSKKFAEWFYHPNNIGGIKLKINAEKYMLGLTSVYYWENNLNNFAKLVKVQNYTLRYLVRKLAKRERRITAWVQYLEDLRVPSIVY